MARLCKFFDEVLVPHPQAPGLWSLLMETRVVLAPYGSDAALEQRLADEVAAKQAHERDGEAEMMAYDAVAPELLLGDPAALRGRSDRCWWLHHDGMMGPGLGAALASDGSVLVVWIVAEG